VFSGQRTFDKKKPEPDRGGDSLVTYKQKRHFGVVVKKERGIFKRGIWGSTFQDHNLVKLKPN
jgi:hypothetical protein